MSDLNRAVRRVMPSGIGRGGSSVCWWCHNRGHHRHAAAFSAPRQSIRFFRSTATATASSAASSSAMARVCGTPISAYCRMNRFYLLFPEIGF